MTTAPAVLSPEQEAAVRQSFARHGLMHHAENGAETVCAVMQQTIAPVLKRY